jgi:hypothetical protein
MHSNPENRSIAGPVIGGAAVCLLMLVPHFSKAVQLFDNATAPDTSNAATLAIDQLGFEGYDYLKSKGYGRVSANDDAHITLDKAILNNPQDASAGGTATYLTTAPGTLAFEKVTVTCPAGDPAKFSTSQKCKVVNITPSSYSPQSFS